MTDLATTEREPQTVELTTEYVAGDAFGYRRGLRALAHAFDDLTADFGDDFYERMALDPTVTATDHILRASMIADGLRLESPISDKEADGYDLGQEIVTFCRAVLDNMQTPLDDVLWDTAAAIRLGSRVAELVWEERTVRSWFVLDQSTAVSQDQTLLTLRAIKVKPRRATSFVVDQFMNLHGLLARRPGTTRGMALISADGQALPDLLPREKFLVYSFRPEHGDPRGRTAFRSAFNPWNIKQQTYPELLKFLAQFASPSVYATAGEKAQPVNIPQPDGTVKLVEPVQALLEALLNFQNGSALALPYGAVVGLIQSSGKGEAFFATLTHCDTQIALGVLHQTLAALEAQYQARASSEVHQDTGDTIIRQAQRGLALAFRRDVLRPLVLYNYGERAAAQLTPLASLGSVEQEDRAQLMNAIAQLARASYLDLSQLPGVDALLGLPPRAQLAEPEPEPEQGPGDQKEQGEEEGDEEQNQQQGAAA